MKNDGTKYLIMYGITLIVIFSGLLAISKMGAEIPIGATINELKTTKDKIISYKEENGEVEYLYNSDIPIINELNEDIEKRTRNAKVFKLSDKEYQAKIYSGEPFYKDIEGKWYQTEIATTTKEEFDKQISISKIFKMALADTFYSGTGDGHVGMNNETTWALAHDALTGETNSNLAATAYVDSLPSLFDIYRAFFPFNTSVIPDEATITSATLQINIATVYSGAGTRNLGLVQTTQASNTTLGDADFDQCGAISNPTEGATRISGSTTGIKTFTLNATGLTWIKTATQSATCGALVQGWTCLGIRTGWLDIDNVEADASNSLDIAISTSEATGITNDPLLTVNYTISGGGATGIILFE